MYEQLVRERREVAWTALQQHLFYVVFSERGTPAESWLKSNQTLEEKG